MSDTQWPRYEVFKQDTANKPHQAVGSVHAPDAAMALQTARDVFVRRPRCYSLWVAPAEAILSVTAQQTAGLEPPPAPEDVPQRYHVFRKTSQRRSMTFVDHYGALDAPSAYAALQLAQKRFEEETTWVWWIVPEVAITRSLAEDAASWFEPATTKTYRNQSYYGFVGPRSKHGRSGSAEKDEK